MTGGQGKLFAFWVCLDDTPLNSLRAANLNFGCDVSVLLVLAQFLWNVNEGKDLSLDVL